MELRHLVAQEVAPEARCVVVLTHSPQDQPLRDLLPFLAVERHGAFAAYQSTHRANSAGRTLQKANHVACLTRLPDSWVMPLLPDLPFAEKGKKYGWYLFVGIYEKERVYTRPSEEVFADPWIVALQKGFGAKGLAREQRDAAGQEIETYQFSRTAWMRPLIGRLVVSAASSPTYARLLDDFDRQAFDVPAAYEHYLDLMGGHEAVEQRVASILTRLRG